MYMLWVRLPGRQCFNVLLVVKNVICCTDLSCIMQQCLSPQHFQMPGYLNLKIDILSCVGGFLISAPLLLILISRKMHINTRETIDRSFNTCVYDKCLSP